MFSSHIDANYVIDHVNCVVDDEKSVIDHENDVINDAPNVNDDEKYVIDHAASVTDDALFVINDQKCVIEDVIFAIPAATPGPFLPLQCSSLPTIPFFHSRHVLRPLPSPGKHSG